MAGKARKRLLQKRTDEWFELAADSLGRCCPNTFQPDTVVCPLCSYVRTRAGMSVEHVPAGALGGKPLVLTCRECNNRTGSGAERMATEHDQLRRGTFGTKPVKVTIGGVRVNAAMSIEGDTLVLNADDKHNAPGKVAAWTERVREQQALGLQPVEVELPRAIDEYVVDVAWLKAAYLVLYAAIGHAVILSPVFQPVRDQIANEKERLIEGFCLAPNADLEHREIRVIIGPEELEHCFLVQFGDRGVILPSPYRARDPYPFLKQQVPPAGGASTLGLSSDLYRSWPVGMAFADDDSGWGWQDIITLVEPAHP